jgi:NAD dependent epimerase/dehydratase family
MGFAKAVLDFRRRVSPLLDRERVKKKRIVITGAKGRIGWALMKQLQGEYYLTPVDLPEANVCNFDDMQRIFRRVQPQVVVHLAWNMTKEDWKSERTCRDNTEMCENIFALAHEHGTRVIFASSIHVEKYREHYLSGCKALITPNKDPHPDGPYGAHKIFLEKLGRWHADKGLEVVCVRFGSLAPKDKPWDDIPLVGLSHPDCANMIRSCIEAQSVPDNYTKFYAVSDNKQRIHDYSNPFGWRPLDDAVDFYEIPQDAKERGFMGL